MELETSAPYIHQQNGQVEQFIRTMMEKAQSLRFNACLPQSWWEFCTEHAVYLYNCTLLQCTKFVTLHKSLLKKKPDVSQLQVFGCGAYMYLPPEK